MIKSRAYSKEGRQNHDEIFTQTTIVGKDNLVSDSEKALTIVCPHCKKEIVISGTQEHPAIVKEGGKLYAHNPHEENNHG